MQGTLTCIFAPSVIIVPALSGLACIHSLFHFKFSSATGKMALCLWLVHACGCADLDYTFSSGPRETPGYDNRDDAVEFCCRGPCGVLIC